MEVKNLLGKLQTQPEGEQAAVPRVPTPPIPRTASRVPAVEDRVAKNFAVSGGRDMTREEHDDGIILDLGEGISLNIPIQRRMSLTDFIKLAEKVKALEMLSESTDVYRKGPL